MRQLKIKVGVAHLLMMAISLCFFVGCMRQKTQTDKITLTVSAAASLSDCMETLETAFAKEYPSIQLRFNYGASGTLQQQIEQGAPVDVFFSAGMKQMKVLEDGGYLIPNSIDELVSNKLALVVPKGGRTELTFETLGISGLDKLAIGEAASVPAGQYTMQVFENLGIVKTLQSHIVYAKDVREVLAWIETGNVDAGVVYETDAKGRGQVVICDLADETLHASITYPIAVVKKTPYEKEARIFIEFIKTEQGRNILKEYGFTPQF